jgi:bifunctional DNA-binding transcriptional regulator/antitoxin component of YhaV-PrlF toxin-antitoxin module
MGNSLVLVIDKPIRRLLGIGRKTLLEVRTDGQRIVIEPVERATESNATDPLGLDEVPPLTLELAARGVFDALVSSGLGQDEFRRLHHRSSRSMAYEAWLHNGGPCRATADDITTMRRLHECLARLRAGRSWEEAMEASLRRYPLPQVS